MSVDPQPVAQPPPAIPPGAPPVASAAGPAGSDAPAPAAQLTPEEQMAAFEKDLKENDWGHQPC